MPDSNADKIALIKRITADWTESLRGLVDTIPYDAEATAINLADWFPTTKREHDRIVLMGDAAHTMTMCKTPSFFYIYILLFSMVSLLKEKPCSSW